MQTKRLTIQFEDGGIDVFTVSNKEMIPPLVRIIQGFGGRIVKHFSFDDLPRGGVVPMGETHTGSETRPRE